MTSTNGTQVRDPGSTSGIDLGVDWSDVDTLKGQIEDLDFQRVLAFRPTRLNRVRLMFTSRRWHWFASGRTLLDLAARLERTGLPVNGGFTCRSDYWRTQAALDSAAAAAPPSAVKNYAANEIANRARDYVFVIETEAAYTNLDVAGRERLRHSLLHHPNHTVGQSNLGRTQIVISPDGATARHAATMIGAKAASCIRHELAITSIRVCRAADWYTELARNPDGRVEPEIEQALKFHLDAHRPW